MLILGISCFYHDAAAALIRDGVLVSAAEEERFSRKKHDFDFPINAIKYCLESSGISVNELDYVVFYEKPFLKFERILKTCVTTFPKSYRLFSESMTSWLGEKLWIKSLIKDKIDYKGEVLFTEHHLSHAASAFFASPFREAAILTVDGVGEWTTTATWIGKENQIKPLREIKFPHSLGLLYSVFTAFLGFEVNEGEYKVMGMAPYGKPEYMDKIYDLIKVERDGSFFLDMSYFSYHYSHDKAFNRKFIDHFGNPRNPKEKDNIVPYYADIGASIQKVTEEVLLQIANQLYRETGMKKLCMAGGVALNSVANGRILRETPFEEIFIQPAAGDSGGALGAALYVYYSFLNKERLFIQEHSYWGPEYGNGRTKEFLDQNGIKYKEYNNEDKLLDTVTELLADGQVIGWHQGKLEWGPRALGNRSILADPRKAEMKDTVNRKIKFREPFRPFAPSVLIDRTEEFFELSEAYRHYPARFMLYVADVKENKKDIIPAITHVDGTARLQCVYEEYSPRYYKLIEKFGELTGVPVVLNTSFNLKGEPIVCTPGEAFSTFSRSGMDALVLGDFLIKKE